MPGSLGDDVDRGLRQALGLRSTAKVELLGSYSSYSYSFSRLERLQELTPRSLPTPQHKIKQRQRRLTASEALDLAAAYRSGQTQAQLAEQFGIHVDTVQKMLRRQGVVARQRYRRFEQANEARRLYETGLSLAKVGAHFGVTDMTVRRALLEIGVIMRPVKGGRPR